MLSPLLLVTKVCGLLAGVTELKLIIMILIEYLSTVLNFSNRFNIAQQNSSLSAVLILTKVLPNAGNVSM